MRRETPMQRVEHDLLSEHAGLHAAAAPARAPRGDLRVCRCFPSFMLLARSNLRATTLILTHLENTCNIDRPGAAWPGPRSDCGLADDNACSVAAFQASMTPDGSQKCVQSNAEGCASLRVRLHTFLRTIRSHGSLERGHAASIVIGQTAVAAWPRPSRPWAVDVAGVF